VNAKRRKKNFRSIYNTRISLMFKTPLSRYAMERVKAFITNIQLYI